MLPGAFHRILAEQHRTVRQVAGAAGLNHGFVSRLARGQRRASRGTVLALLEVLDVRPSDLFELPETTLPESPRTDSGDPPAPDDDAP